MWFILRLTVAPRLRIRTDHRKPEPSPVGPQLLIPSEPYNSQRIFDRSTNLRNGIAHNNVSSLSRVLGGREFPHISDARLAVAALDPLPYVVSGIVALQKLSSAWAGQAKKQDSIGVV